jgi:hypothetical protein
LLQYEILLCFFSGPTGNNLVSIFTFNAGQGKSHEVDREAMLVLNLQLTGIYQRALTGKLRPMEGNRSRWREFDSSTEKTLSEPFETAECPPVFSFWPDGQQLPVRAYRQLDARARIYRTPLRKA